MSTRALLLVAAVTLIAPSLADEVCPDYFGRGYFSDKNYKSGLPSDTYVHRPVVDGSPTLSACELAEIHTHCVTRINQYRSGALKFNDNTDDANVLSGLAPMSQNSGSQRCSSESALGDLLVQGGDRGCGGAHANAFSCMQGAQGQNSCCGYGVKVTVKGIKERLDQCLQSMWDEGITPGQKGHWETMRSKTYAYVSCGFAWSSEGLIFMNQDFSSSLPDGSSGSSLQLGAACSCDGKKIGESDGCGGFCTGVRTDSATHRIVAAVMLPLGLVAAAAALWCESKSFASARARPPRDSHPIAVACS